MKISSYELAHCANFMLSELKKIRDKIDFYSNEELKKRNGSNFSLEIPEQEDIFLIKIERVLSEKEEISIDSDTATLLLEKYKEAPNKFKEFDEQCDSIYSSQNGSHDKAFFYTPFSRWFNDTYNLIRDLYLQFLDRLEIKDIIANKQKYEKILENATSKEDELQQLINNVKNSSDEILLNVKNKSDELLLELEQNVAEHKVSDIKVYYSKAIQKTQKDIIINAIFYYGLSIIMTALLVLLFWNMKNIYPNDYLLIPKSILSCTLIGFVSFVINDFRKRFNISKNILDELLQKEIVVDTYSSLLSRIKDFDDDTKKQYHEKIIQNIIDTLLLIRNHGYLSKTFNQSSPDYATKIIEELGNIVQKK